MQCATGALRAVHKLSLERWTLHKLNQRHTGDIEEGASVLANVK